eukprot:scaffold9175_cov57-Phaeocystis_antarctica.AAC.1
MVRLLYEGVDILGRLHRRQARIRGYALGYLVNPPSAWPREGRSRGLRPGVSPGTAQLLRANLQAFQGRPHRLCTGAIGPAATAIARSHARIVVSRGLVMAALDDDTGSHLRVLWCARVVDEPHRNERQLAQRPLLHRHPLQLRKPSEPALRVVWYFQASIREGIVGDVPIRGESLHDGPCPAPADSEGTIHDAAPLNAAERGEATLSPAARDQPRLEGKRVLAQLEHQTQTVTRASLALFLGVDQEHAGAKVAPLQRWG